MKKSIYILASLFMLLLTSPIFAQVEDPGDDPDSAAAPISDYIWVLAAIGLVYVFFKIRAFAKQANIES